ncbi:MAG: hypothetical protein GMKNLPBB_00807 [Myxococcota bacterium]|nr:hypothetical protein [Myxococcota bacterium]
MAGDSMGDELEKKEPAPTNQAAEHQNPQPANMAVPTPPSGVQYTQNNLILTPIAALPNLPHDIQKDVVANVDKSDERNFQYFLKTLDNQEAENKRMHESETRNAGFRHGIVIMTGSFIMIISVLLVYKEKYEMLMELMKILIPFIIGGMGGYGYGRYQRPRHDQRNE